MPASSSQPDLVQTLRRRLQACEAAHRPTAAAFSSGCPALDRVLPQRGLQRATLIEYLADGGSGASALALIAAREACREGGALVVVDHDRRFNPPAAASLGVDLAGTIFVRPRSGKDQLWALNQCLSCPGVGAVVAWPKKLDGRAFRTLQLAAERSGAAGFFVRPMAARGDPSWSGLQLLVEALPAGKRTRRLRVEVARCRHGQAGASVEVELDDGTGTFRESRALPLAAAVAAAAAAAGAPGA